jgi:2,3-bisphosphoglycerate-dependent phosphoglycerate mutase
MKRTSIPGTLAAILLLVFPALAFGQRAVFVVRHAEKASEANDASVPLSEAGTARAKRLAAILKDAGITAIYSTDTVRTRKTAEPLAAFARTDVRIYEATTADGKVDVQPLAERLRKEHAKDAVLVVGHSNTIGPLLAALGCTEDVSIAGNEYDNLFIVVARGQGSPVLLRLRY